MSAPRLRDARLADWPAVRAMLEAAELPHADLSPAAMREFLVAEEAAAVCGAVGLEPAGPVGLLRSLVVAQSVRGRGLGETLLTALEQRASERGVVELWLLTIDAGEFFARRGYAPKPREAAPPAIRGSREFSSLCPADAALYSKRLY